jgi:integrase
LARGGFRRLLGAAAAQEQIHRRVHIALDFRARHRIADSLADAHVVGHHAQTQAPLSSAAIEVLKTAFDGREDGYAFTNRDEEALDAKVMTRFFARLTKAIKVEDFTVHDLRRTGATMLTSERLGVMGEIISRILNHTPPGPAITRVYNRNSYLPQKRAALDLWAAEMNSIVAYRGREQPSGRPIQGTLVNANLLRDYEIKP